MRLSEIKSGDVLCWQGLGLFGKVIRLATGSKFSHVGVAYRSPFSNNLLVADAMIGRGVTITNFRHADQTMWCLPLSSLKLSEDNLQTGRTFIFERLGLKYSIKDCWHAMCRKPLKAKGYQCAEFVNEYLQEMGVQTGIEYPTPARVIDFLGEPILVNPNPSDIELSAID